MENKKPKILVVTVSAWNDKVGSNTWGSLLEEYDSKNIANLCIRPQMPTSKIASRYFTISENKVIKSILNPKIKTGTEVSVIKSGNETSDDLKEHNARYQKMKKNRRYSMLMARELVWKLGKWRTSELYEFLDSFKPDIILHSMEGYIHLNRIIEYAIKRTGAKAVGYIWDDNFTYKQSNKIGHKIYRFFQRRSLKSLAKSTQEFFAISDMTKKEADEFFGINCHILTKPIKSVSTYCYKRPSLPIKMLYTGNLGIGRDKTLLTLVNTINKYFANDFVIDVYTHTLLQDDVRDKLDCSVCKIHSAVSQSKAIAMQKQADILLFLEDIDSDDARTARLSFSTKTTDYLSAGRTIFALGCKDTAPMQYFIKNKCAITATNNIEVCEGLKKIVKDNDVLVKYAKASKQVGLKNHDKQKIQLIFDNVINKVCEE